MRQPDDPLASSRPVHQRPPPRGPTYDEYWRVSSFLKGLPSRPADAGVNAKQEKIAPYTRRFDTVQEFAQGLSPAAFDYLKRSYAKLAAPEEQLLAQQQLREADKALKNAESYVKWGPLALAAVNAPFHAVTLGLVDNPFVSDEEFQERYASEMGKWLAAYSIKTKQPLEKLQRDMESGKWDPFRWHHRTAMVPGLLEMLLPFKLASKGLGYLFSKAEQWLVRGAKGSKGWRVGRELMRAGTMERTARSTVRALTKGGATFGVVEAAWHRPGDPSVLDRMRTAEGRLSADAALGEWVQEQSWLEDARFTTSDPRDMRLQKEFHDFLRGRLRRGMDPGTTAQELLESGALPGPLHDWLKKVSAPVMPSDVTPVDMLRAASEELLSRGGRFARGFGLGVGTHVAAGAVTATLELPWLLRGKSFPVWLDADPNYFSQFKRGLQRVPHRGFVTKIERGKIHWAEAQGVAGPRGMVLTRAGQRAAQGKWVPGEPSGVIRGKPGQGVRQILAHEGFPAAGEIEFAGRQWWLGKRIRLRDRLGMGATFGALHLMGEEETDWEEALVSAALGFVMPKGLWPKLKARRQQAALAEEYLERWQKSWVENLLSTRGKNRLMQETEGWEDVGGVNWTRPEAGVSPEGLREAFLEGGFRNMARQPRGLPMPGLPVSRERQLEYAQRPPLGFPALPARLQDLGPHISGRTYRDVKTGKVAPKPRGRPTSQEMVESARHQRHLLRELIEKAPERLVEQQDPGIVVPSRRLIVPRALTMDPPWERRTESRRRIDTDTEDLLELIDNWVYTHTGMSLERQAGRESEATFQALSQYEQGLRMTVNSHLQRHFGHTLESLIQGRQAWPEMWTEDPILARLGQYFPGTRGAKGPGGWPGRELTGSQQLVVRGHLEDLRESSREAAREYALRHPEVNLADALDVADHALLTSVAELKPDSVGPGRSGFTAAVEGLSGSVQRRLDDAVQLSAERGRALAAGQNTVRGILDQRGVYKPLEDPNLTPVEGKQLERAMEQAGQVWELLQGEEFVDPGWVHFQPRAFEVFWRGIVEGVAPGSGMQFRGKTYRELAEQDLASGARQGTGVEALEKEYRRRLAPLVEEMRRFWSDVEEGESRGVEFKPDRSEYEEARRQMPRPTMPEREVEAEAVEGVKLTESQRAAWKELGDIHALEVSRAELTGDPIHTQQARLVSRIIRGEDPRAAYRRIGKSVAKKNRTAFQRFFEKLKVVLAKLGAAVKDIARQVPPVLVSAAAIYGLEKFGIADLDATMYGMAVPGMFRMPDGWLTPFTKGPAWVGNRAASFWSGTRTFLEALPRSVWSSMAEADPKITMERLRKKGDYNKISNWFAKVWGEPDGKVTTEALRKAQISEITLYQKMAEMRDEFIGPDGLFTNIKEVPDWIDKKTGKVNPRYTGGGYDPRSVSMFIADALDAYRAFTPNGWRATGADFEARYQARLAELDVKDRPIAERAFKGMRRHLDEFRREIAELRRAHLRANLGLKPGEDIPADELLEEIPVFGIDDYFPHMWPELRNKPSWFDVTPAWFRMMLERKPKGTRFMMERRTDRTDYVRDAVYVAKNYFPVMRRWVEMQKLAKELDPYIYGEYTPMSMLTRKGGEWREHARGLTSRFINYLTQNDSQKMGIRYAAPLRGEDGKFLRTKSGGYRRDRMRLWIPAEKYEGASNIRLRSMDQTMGHEEFPWEDFAKNARVRTGGIVQLQQPRRTKLAAEWLTDVINKGPETNRFLSHIRGWFYHSALGGLQYRPAFHNWVGGHWLGWTELGTYYWAKGMALSHRKEGKEILEQSGVLGESGILWDMETPRTRAAQKVRKASMFPFMVTEKDTRATVYLGARLRELDRQKARGEEENLEAAHEAGVDALVKASAMYTFSGAPGIFRSPLGRTLMHLNRFSVAYANQFMRAASEWRERPERLIRGMLGFMAIHQFMQMLDFNYGFIAGPQVMDVGEPFDQLLGGTLGDKLSDMKLPTEPFYTILTNPRRKIEEWKNHPMAALGNFHLPFYALPYDYPMPIRAATDMIKVAWQALDDDRGWMDGLYYGIQNMQAKTTESLVPGWWFIKRALQSYSVKTGKPAPLVGYIDMRPGDTPGTWEVMGPRDRMQYTMTEEQFWKRLLPGQIQSATNQMHLRMIDAAEAEKSDMNRQRAYDRLFEALDAGDRELVEQIVREYSFRWQDLVYQADMKGVPSWIRRLSGTSEDIAEAIIRHWDYERLAKTRPDEVLEAINRKIRTPQRLKPAVRSRLAEVVVEAAQRLEG